MNNLHLNYRNWLILTAIVVASALAAYLWISLGNRPYVPREFFEARIKGGDLSEKIVRISKESIDNLREIEKFGKDKNYSKALSLVQDEISRNELAREEALSLSDQLGIMAFWVENIKPKEASNLAFQAVLSESQIVQRLINYNGHISQLLGSLRDGFSTKTGERNEDVVRGLIIKMNEEINAINDLNDRYRDLMREFDILTIR